MLDTRDMIENSDEEIECSAATLRLMLREREQTLQLAATYGLQLQESNEELHSQLRAAESALELEALATREANRRAERALAELKELQAELRERDSHPRSMTDPDSPWPLGAAAAAFSPLSSVSSASSRSLSDESPHFFRSTPDQSRRLSTASTASSGISPCNSTFTFKVADNGFSSKCSPAAIAALLPVEGDRETISYLKMRQRSLEEDIEDLKHEVHVLMIVKFCLHAIFPLITHPLPALLLFAAGALQRFAVTLSCRMRRFDCRASSRRHCTITIAARQSLVGHSIDALAQLHCVLFSHPVAGANSEPTHEQRCVHVAPAL